MSKAFASQADLQDKKITFEQLSPHCWAYTAEGDPNSGVIIGDDFIMVSDATATPAMARDLIKQDPHRQRQADQVRAADPLPRGARAGRQRLLRRRRDRDHRQPGHAGTDPRARRAGHAERDGALPAPVPWRRVGAGPDLAEHGHRRRRRDVKGEKPGKLSINLGGVVVQIWSPGHGHTRGDTIAWVEDEKVLFSGDLVEYEAGVYTGDAQLEEWPATLEALRALNAEFIVPGRGEAMKGNADVNKALDYTKRWVTTLFQAGKEAAAANMDLKGAMALTRKSMDPVFGHVFIYEHCLPFDVSRAYDEAKGIKNPRIWTAERDMEMWKSLQG
jgi:glyoxylase-like metal-dependent hydrolase (beta-lactamase superfamily II)